jgi:aminopeptidase N
MLLKMSGDIQIRCYATSMRQAAGCAGLERFADFVERFLDIRCTTVLFRRGAGVCSAAIGGSRMKRIIASGVIAFAAALPAHAVGPYKFETTPGKLPKDVVPLSYDIHLSPSAALDAVRGTERIALQVRRRTARILLNAANLSIASARLEAPGRQSALLAPLLDPARETLRFDLARPLAPGRYVLVLTFGARVNREDRGLFAVRYRVGDTRKTMLATTMEPADARRVFPVWDEPSFRARFRLSVDLPAAFEAVSNTPVASRMDLPDGRRRLRFRWTPRMPSYLLALAAGELERASTAAEGVDIGVVTTAGKGAATVFALAANGAQLHFYNDYFGVPYPLPKLDHIALPSGFSGAMENWGAIAYNEATLLVDPGRSPESVRKLVFEVTAHETAHQWFGNLVTMAWWNDLWLNEGFASWMAAKATELLHPEWHARLDGIAARDGVMALDALDGAHPVRARVDNEAQAADAFDAITYTKGEALLRMLEAYLGDGVFKAGIRRYVARHRYSNTTDADLWAALEGASGKPVARMAADWTDHPGFPLVDAIQSCVNGRRTVRLAQSPFRPDESAAPAVTWHIPVVVGAGPGVLLQGAAVDVSRPGCGAPLVVDPEAVGYFRVRYDAASFRALAADAPDLPDAARLKLVQDTWALASAGMVPLEHWWMLVERLGGEPRLAVWNSVVTGLAALDGFARGTPQQAGVRARVLALVRPRMAGLGWAARTGEPAEAARLRALLARALADAGDADALAQARAGFERYVGDPASVDPAQLDFVLGTGARHADAATFDILRRLLLQAQRGEERSRLLRAIVQIEDPALVPAALDLALAPELPPNMAVPLVQGLARADFARAWAFAVAHRERLLGSQNALAANKTFPAMAEASANPADAATIEAYAHERLGPEAQAGARRVAAGVRARAAQRERLLAQLGGARGTGAVSAEGTNHH